MLTSSVMAWGCVAAGATIVAIGGICWVRDLARRRPWADVLDNIEPPRVAMPLRCICEARFSFCDCAIDGKRNPRGAGRARMMQRERNIAEAVRTGIPCRPIVGGKHQGYNCAECGRGPCHGADRVAPPPSWREMLERVDRETPPLVVRRDLDATPWACPVGVCTEPQGCTTPRVCRAVEAQR